jgi:sugar phosphate isomerase/epimerase
MIGISTAWFTEREEITGLDIVREIVELGFNAVELEYRVRETTFREMRPLILGEKLRVMSIHNFFPLPDDAPFSSASGDRFLLSSPDKEARDVAIRMTIRTIEYAGDLGAAAVVLHLGKVEMDPEKERLYDFFNREGLSSPEGRLFLQSKLKERRERRGPYLDSIFFSLDRLNREAAKRGIILGVENRYYYHQIPDFGEVGLILDHFPGGSIRYWHDVGHAHVLERLGIIEPESLLSSYGRHMGGIHIHDAVGTDDHWAPGAGEIHFMGQADWLRSAPIKILEVHKKSDRLEVVKGMDMLKGIGIV